MKKQYFLIALIVTIIALFTSQAQTRVVPGRIVVQFKSGTVSLPEGATKLSIDKSNILDPVTLEACTKIAAREIEKAFPSAIPGRTTTISPITGQISR